MLGDCELVVFSQTTKPDEAKRFYGEVLGLKLEEDTPFAIVFRAGRSMLRIQKTGPFTPLTFTSLGWNVADITTLARELRCRSARFERFEGMEQDADGIWKAPSGARVCWFKDPDGNILSLSQLA